jgi:hypothetical protein
MTNYAFVHIQKSAGTYVDSCIIRSLVPKGYKIYNPWYLTRAEIANLGRGIPFERTISKEEYRRDWSTSELLHIKSLPGKKYVHNHSKNWKEVFDEYNKDFFTFSFLRNPLDIMCSMYTFLKEKPGEPSDPAWGFPKNPQGMSSSLNDFILEYTFNLDTLLPDYTKLDFFKIFSEENLAILMQNHLNSKHVPGTKINTSNNQGYMIHMKNKEISQEAIDLVFQTEMYDVYQKLINSKEDNICRTT